MNFTLDIARAFESFQHRLVAVCLAFVTWILLAVCAGNKILGVQIASWFAWPAACMAALSFLMLLYICILPDSTGGDSSGKTVGIGALSAKIESPPDGSTVGRKFDIFGTLEGAIPDGYSVWVFTRTLSEVSPMYYPDARVTVTEGGTTFLFTRDANHPGDKDVILLVAVDRDMKTLIDEYVSINDRHRGTGSKNWVGLRTLTSGARILTRQPTVVTIAR